MLCFRYTNSMKSCDCYKCRQRRCALWIGLIAAFFAIATIFAAIFVLFHFSH